jgi:serine phosphatase RsbU (regulator of sigma subunit)
VRTNTSPGVDAAVSERAPAPRPRTLVVGDLALSSGEAWLRVAVEARRVRAEEALAALGDDPPELVLIDGRLPGDVLGELLGRVGHTDRLERPGVVVVTEEGRRTGVDSSLVDHADDFVNGALGPEVLLARIRTVLRVRAALAELARKNAELQALSGRLEILAGRMAEELRLASHIQRSLLPPPLSHPRLDVAAEFIPVREIGGDYYDVFTLEGGRLAVALGDVMGKGVPAALLAAHLKACLRAQSPGEAASPAEVISRVNRVFGELTPRGLFATLFFAVFDFETATLCYVNAGHEPGLLVHGDGGAEPLSSGGPVLGLFDDSEYRGGRVALRPDDLIVLYSDGLTDRAAPTGELYGEARLREAARRAHRDPVRIALYTLLGEVQGWSEGRPAEDDQTLIVARVRSEA